MAVSLEFCKSRAQNHWGCSAQVQQASEAAWKDVHSANQKALEQLQKGWADAFKRFA